jgi:hypothetical protein
MNTPTPRPWPMAPLWRLMEAGTRAEDGVLGPREAAAMLGVSGSTVTTSIRDGLTDRQADEWATRLGHHPAAVYGDDWYRYALEGERTCGREACGEPFVPTHDDQWHCSVACRRTEATRTYKARMRALGKAA